MRKLFGLVAILCSSMTAYAADERAVAVGSRAAPHAAATTSISGNGFSVDLPLIARIRGAAAYFYTALDITNQSSQATDVSFEYISGDLSVDVVATLVQGLPPFVSFHQDDFLQFLAAQGLLSQAQADNAFGTLLVSFSNPSFTTGREASVTARIYSLDSSTLRGTDAFEYRGQVVRINGLHALASIARNTSASSGNAGQLSTNLGLEDVGVDDAGRVDGNPVSVSLTFYDASSGIAVGPQPVLALQPGQVSQITDLWNSYQLPVSVTDIVVVATQVSGTAQIRGYVALKDINTNSVSFLYMQ